MCQNHTRLDVGLRSRYNPNIRFRVLPCQLRLSCTKAYFWQAMKILTLSRACLLSCLLLLTNISFALRDADIAMKYSMGTAVNSAFARTSLLAVLAQQTASPAKADSAPQPTTQLPPDSYVGTVVAIMFLAGIVLLLVKWSRRRVRGTVYPFPRAHGKRRRAS